MIARAALVEELKKRGHLDLFVRREGFTPDQAGLLLGQLVVINEDLPPGVGAFVNEREFGYLCGAFRGVIDVLNSTAGVALFFGQQIVVRP